MSDGKGRDMIKTNANRAVEAVAKKWEEEECGVCEDYKEKTVI